MEVRGPLPVETARLSAAVFSGAEPLEAFLDDGGVFTMIVSVHLNIWRTDVHFVTAALKGQRL